MAFCIYTTQKKQLTFYKKNVIIISESKTKAK